MKRSYFFIGGSIVILILIGFWVYSFLYGNTDNDANFFADLGIFNNETPIISEPTLPTLSSTTTPEVDMPSLRQISTKPIIGMLMVKGQTGTSTMRYVEAGTGHIYDYDLKANTETRISPISIPEANLAVISPHGDYVAILSGSTNQSEVVLVDLTDLNNPTSTVLPYKITDFAFGFNNELLFTEVSYQNTEGKGYLPSTGSVRRLFSIPFSVSRVLFSTSSNTPHYVYTKPSNNLPGYAYEIRGVGIKRLPFAYYGLTMIGQGDSLLVGNMVDNKHQTIHYQKSTQLTNRLPINTLPEKCVFAKNNDQSLYCAANYTSDMAFGNDWYSGTTVADDKIWRLKLGGPATLLFDPEDEAGETLDIIKPHVSTDNKVLYFINKNDNTLWVYDL